MRCQSIRFRYHQKLSEKIINNNSVPYDHQNNECPIFTQMLFIIMTITTEDINPTLWRKVVIKGFQKVPILRPKGALMLFWRLLNYYLFKAKPFVSWGRKAQGLVSLFIGVDSVFISLLKKIAGLPNVTSLCSHHGRLVFLFLMRRRNPCPQGMVRVQRLCHLNSSLLPRS